MLPSPPRPPRPRPWEPYLARLRADYPHADPPSLAVAFLALHELTALVPLVALFALFRHLALGTGLVAWVLAHSEDGGERAQPGAGGWRDTARDWLSEAEDKAERVGRRYGWFGWDKETPEQRKERRAGEVEARAEGREVQRTADQLRVSGDVANAAAAYLAVKALIPLRILISLRLSPSLANVIAHNFHGLRERGRRYVARAAPSAGEAVKGTGGQASVVGQQRAMQTLRLKRLLITHYSLLIPFPPPPPSPRPSPSPSSGPPILEPTAQGGTLSRGGTWRRVFGRGGCAGADGERSAQGDRKQEAEGAQPAYPLGEAALAPAERDTIEEVPASSGALVEKEEEEERKREGPIRLVGFSDPDPLNPQCWSTPRRVCITALLALLCTWVGACSAMNASLWREAAADLGVGTEVVMNLDTALFLAGFGLAAPLWAPLSELAGRNPIYFVSLLLLALFEIGAALSRTLASRLVLRFLAGCAATTPLSNAGAAMGDLWNEDERSAAFGVFGVGGFLGPCLGPVISGWIAQSGWSYRWADWVQAIGAAVLLVVSFLLLPETYPPTLLALKAAAIRRRSRSAAYLTPLEQTRRQISFAHDFRLTLARPFAMLAREPIVVCFCAYLTLVFIIMFGNLTGYPHIFAPYALSPGLSGSLFLSIALGLFLCALATPLMRADYRRCVARAAKAGAAVQPEVRLRVAIVGTWAVPGSLFWAAWVTRADVSIWASLGAQALFGIGVWCCFYSTFLYTIDSYGHKAASALAALTFLRYPIAGGAVLFTPFMYERLNPHYTLTLLACLSLLLSLVPWGFCRFGARIRGWSRWTVH
ncbi:hypothetical protein JCM10449v2_002222 [Rhodotorula kratochvilovae]